ncbi:MAG: APC family permease [Nocardioides sp.]
MTQQTTAARLGSASKLRLLDAVAQSVGFMGPVFSIAFLVPLVMGITSQTGKGAGVAAPLAVAIAAVGVLALGWIVAAYAKKIHAAGSLYDYVTAGFGSRVGGAAGLLYYSGILMLGAAILVVLGGTIRDTLDAEFGTPFLPEVVWDLLLLAIVAVMIFRGASLSTRLQLVLAVVSMVVVGLFSILVIIDAGGGNSLGTAFNPGEAPGGISGVAFGVLYGVLLFTGFETAANLGEETDNPGVNIPKAVLYSVLAIAGFYLICTYAQVVGFGFDLDAFGAAAGAPLFALAAPSAGGVGSLGLLRIVELVVILDMLAVLIGCATAGARGLFALARDGRLPKPLAGVSPGGAPSAAGLVVLVCYVAAILITVGTSWWTIPELPHYFGVFVALSGYGSFAMALIYLLMCAGAFRGLADHPNPTALTVASVVGIVVVGGALFGAMYQAPDLTAKTQWVAFGLLALGLLLPGRSASHTGFDELSVADRGPQKL